MTEATRRVLEVGQMSVTNMSLHLAMSLSAVKIDGPLCGALRVGLGFIRGLDPKLGTKP